MKGNTMKRISGFLAAAVLTTTLTGCGGLDPLPGSVDQKDSTASASSETRAATATPTNVTEQRALNNCSIDVEFDVNPESVFQDSAAINCEDATFALVGDFSDKTTNHYDQDATGVSNMNIVEFDNSRRAWVSYEDNDETGTCAIIYKVGGPNVDCDIVEDSVIKKDEVTAVKDIDQQPASTATPTSIPDN